MRSSALDLTQSAERERILAFSIGARVPYEREATIHELFSRQAASTPKALAVVVDGAVVTYDELERRSNQVARYLVTLGVTSGASVGVAFERSLELAAALLGILKAGAAYVPLDLCYPAERLGFMIADAAVSMVVTSGAVDALTPFEQVRTVDLERDAAAIAAMPSDPFDVVGDARSLAYITYTSGSTGWPKGVAIEHRGVVRLVRGADYVRIAADDAYLQFAPLAFDASTFEIWAPLLNGARLCIPRRGLLSMDELSETIERFGVTTMFLTTSLFQHLVDTPSARPRSLRSLFTGGEVASPAHMARFLEALPHCGLFAVYGPTENTTFSSWFPIAAIESVDRAIPIGRPIANSSAFVLDARAELVPVGVSGELFVGGDGVGRGYVNLPELTAERFVADPFSDDPSAKLYRTGDRARYREDGVLEFLGRDDDQVKVRGFRIELGDIEIAIQGHEKVRDAAVVLAQHAGEKSLVAYVEPADNARLTETDLREHLARKLPAYMMPHRIVVDRLPKHPSGKIDRVELVRRATFQPQPAPIPSSRLGSSTVQKVWDLWRSVLRGVEPGLDDNFFDAGGDSLLLLTLHKCLQEQLGITLSVVDLFAESTIRKQAAVIDRLST